MPYNKPFSRFCKLLKLLENDGICSLFREGKHAKSLIFPTQSESFSSDKKKKRKIRNTSLFIYYNFYIHYFPKLSVFLREDVQYATLYGTRRKAHGAQRKAHDARRKAHGTQRKTAWCRRSARRKKRKTDKKCNTRYPRQFCAEKRRPIRLLPSSAETKSANALTRQK